MTSAVPGEGKSTFAVSLAMSAVQAGKRVLLIDADLRHPSLASMLGKFGNGLNALYKSDSVDVNAQQMATANPASIIDEVEPRLHIVPVSRGINNPQDILADGRLHSLINLARSRYDLILLDFPPVLAVPDALILSGMVDEAVVVVRWRKTPRSLVLRAINNLLAADIAVGGAVITQVNTKLMASGKMGRDAFLYSQYASYYRELA